MSAVVPTEWTKKMRFARSFLGGRLIHTNLQILYDCNFRCRICDFWKEPYRDRDRMTVEEAETIAAKLASIGPQILSIGGGEPLLHPELEQIVRRLASWHFPVVITNGWLMTKDKARELWEAGLYEISVSVDYASPEKHDEQRGHAGAFERAVAALELLQAARVRRDQRVNMISVIMDDNLADVEPLLQLSRRLGITYLVTLYSDGRGVRPKRGIGADASSILLLLRKKYPEFVALRGYVGRFSEAIAGRGIGPCYAGKHLLHVNPRGGVSLCIDREDEPIANLLADDPNIVEKKLLERFRTNGCRQCWTSCRGSIETVKYGRARLLNLWDYYRMTRPLPLANAGKWTATGS